MLCIIKILFSSQRERSRRNFLMLREIKPNVQLFFLYNFMDNSMNSSKITKYCIAAEKAEKELVCNKSEYFIIYIDISQKNYSSIWEGFFPGYILRNNRENKVFLLVFATANLIPLSALAAKNKNLTESRTGPWWYQIS